MYFLIITSTWLSDNGNVPENKKKLSTGRIGPIQPRIPPGGLCCGSRLRNACENGIAYAPGKGLYTTSHMSLNNTSNGTRCYNRFVSSYTHITCTHTTYQPCTITPHTLCTTHTRTACYHTYYAVLYTYTYILPIHIYYIPSSLSNSAAVSAYFTEIVVSTSCFSFSLPCVLRYRSRAFSFSPFVEPPLNRMSSKTP